MTDPLFDRLNEVIRYLMDNRQLDYAKAVSEAMSRITIAKATNANLLKQNSDLARRMTDGQT